MFKLAPTALLLVLLMPSPAHGQAEPAKAAPIPPTSALIEHQGHKGMWFIMPTARRLLKDVKKFKADQPILKKTEALLDLEKQRSDLLTKQVGSSEEIAEAWKTTAKDQAKLLVNKDPWWRSPYLWTVVGFVMGAATTVGIAVAVRRSGAVE